VRLITIIIIITVIFDNASIILCEIYAFSSMNKVHFFISQTQLSRRGVLCFINFNDAFHSLRQIAKQYKTYISIYVRENVLEISEFAVWGLINLARRESTWCRVAQRKWVKPLEHPDGTCRIIHLSSVPSCTCGESLYRFT